MKDPLLIGISYCGTHNKGDEATSPDAINVSPVEHAEWLLVAVNFWSKLALDRPTRVIVTAVGMPPLLKSPVEERKILWQVNRQATVIAFPDNPGHQLGACIAFKEGLEAACSWGYPRYLHVTEDVLPWPDAVEEFMDDLDRGVDYSGMSWPTGVLNLHMIACRPWALSAFDPFEVRKYLGIEHYFADFVKEKPHKVHATGQGLYITTHDWQQYQSWLKKMPYETNPIVKRVASDKGWRHFG